MRRIYRFILVFVFLIFSASSGSAAIIELFDWAFNIDGTPYESSMGDPLPAGLDDSLFDWDTGLGTLTLTFTPGAAGDYYVIAFFDHQIDEATNTFFNEYGAANNPPSSAGQSWEIDEPGFLFGDIYDNLLAGTLDNTNAIPAGSEDDVSMAIGWDFSLSAKEFAVVDFLLSDTPPPSGFHLSHTDHPESNDGTGASIYFSSYLNTQSIPEPGTVLLLGLGMLSLLGIRRFIVKIS